MSIFGTLLGLFTSSAALGAASAKSNKKVRQMNADFERQFAKGCDPRTEFIIACGVFRKVLDARVRLVREVTKDMEEMPWQELFKKYPEAVQRQNELNRQFGERTVQQSKKERESFLGRYGMFLQYACENEMKKEFLTPYESKQFVQAGVYDLNERFTFEKSIACVVAACKMVEKGFTPVGSARTSRGGYYGNTVGNYPPAGFMYEMTCNPSEQQIRKALSQVGFIDCKQRDGAASSPDGMTEKERQDAKNREKDVLIVALVILGTFLYIIIASALVD